MPPAAPQPSFTPKQVAQALGVSESSVKRWCDRGELRAGKTAGGHRKVPVASLVAWLRESGRELADPATLGLPAATPRRKLSAAVDELFAALVAGDEGSVRALIVGFYQRGAGVDELADELIGPAFGRVGDGWASGEVSVHQERRSCEVTLAVLHELRQWAPASDPAAPLAMIATPERDFAETPMRLVELAVVSRGWRAEVIGAGLPVEEVRAAVLARQPALLCLSVTHLQDPDRYAERHNRLLSPKVLGVPVIIGGGALTCQHAASLECEAFGAKIADLTAWLDHHPLTPRPQTEAASQSDTNEPPEGTTP